MRRAFTLIELMISTILLSIVMTFLYKVYAQLNESNKIVDLKVKNMIVDADIKELIYVDFLKAYSKSIDISEINQNIDILSFQTQNSIHRRFNPYIKYICKNHKLYRLESLNHKNYDIDIVGVVKKFKIYKSKTNNKKYLVYIEFKNKTLLMLTRSFN